LSGTNIANFTAADYDGDGDVDLTTQETDELNVYLQNNGLQFQKQTVPNLDPDYQHLTTPADYDGDKDIDLLMLGYTELKMMENDGHGTFTQRESVRLQYPISNYNFTLTGNADLDNDGDLDFFGIGGYGLSWFKNTTLGEAFPFAEYPFPGFVPLTSGDSDWADYDNDGDLDLLATGANSGVPQTILYENQNGSLVAKSTALINVNLGSCDWGDYDRDGDLDILLMGWISADIFDRKSATAIYTNTNGTFTLLPSSQTQLPQTYYGEARWVDLDNDGWLDIAMNAMAETISGEGSALYRSDGHGNFEKKFALPMVFTDANLATGDYDNDGDLDVAVSGWRGNDDLGALLKVYRNDGAWTFAEAVGDFKGIIGGDLNWADMDTDGDLDLVVSGDQRGAWSSIPTTRVYEIKKGIFTGVENNSFLYRPDGSGSAVVADLDNDGVADVATSNGYYAGLDVFLNKGINNLTDMQTELMYSGSHYLDAVDFDNDNDLDLALEGKLVVNNVDKKNTGPAPPTQLRDSVYNNTLYLYWQDGSDAETPAAALSYQVYAGTKTKTQDIINANADLSDGQRRTVDPGIAKGKVWKITGLSSGPVHWSVQTIDAGFRGSAFAAETQAQFIRLNGPDKVCLESTYTYTAEPAGSYTWKIKGGTIVTGQGTDEISVRWDLTGDAWLVASNSSSKKNTLLIVVDKMPHPFVDGNDQVCTGAESYTVSDLLAVHHHWTVAGGEITGGQNTATVSVKWNAPGSNPLTDEIASEHFGCTTTVALVVEVDQRPQPVIDGPATVCATRGIAYTTEAIHPDWDVTGGTFPPNPGQSMTVTWQSEKGDGEIDLTEVSQNGFCSTSVSLAIKINPLPPKPTIEFAANKLKSTSAAQYQWYLNDVAIPATANGTAREITVNQSGSYRVEGWNLVGCSISSDPFLVTAADAEISNRLTLYPNPAKSAFTLQISGATHYPATVSILDVSGRMMKQLSVHQEITEVDVHDLSPGYYTLTVHDDTSIRYLRLAKY
ncbi:MAG TPA: FG-GAP-like repeat-containing protein, partial [Chryseolinea sp.]